MSIWVFLWLILSCVLLYFMGWTIYILYVQKRVWKAYAQKKSLRYKANKFLEPPEISGTMDDFTIGLFTGEHLSEDARRARSMTALEVQLNSLLPFEALIASGGMVDVLKNLTLNQEIKPKHDKWEKSYVAATNSKAALDEYLTQDRLDALLSLMSMKNAWVIFVFKADITLLRLDTPLPLHKQDVLDRLISKMLKAARVLELKDGEAATLKSKTLLARSQQDVLQDAHDQDLDSPVGFELEDDDNDIQADEGDKGTAQSAEDVGDGEPDDEKEPDEKEPGPKDV